MASTTELIKTICMVVETSRVPIPIALMNHGPEEAAEIIGGVVEYCGRQGITLRRVSIDPELGEELSLVDGKVVEHGDHPAIHCEIGLGRRVRFERAATPDTTVE
jgi:hypothetical protein